MKLSNESVVVELKNSTVVQAEFLCRVVSKCHFQVNQTKCLKCRGPSQARLLALEQNLTSSYQP